jgi:hypothetical protein
MTRPMDRRLPALALLALALTPTVDGAAAEEPVTAVWKERQLHFTYRGYDAVYPCGLLQHRIAIVLAAVGARPDLEVTVGACETPFASGATASADGAPWPQSLPGSVPGQPSAAPGDIGWPRAAYGSGSSRPMEPRQRAEVRIRLSMPTEVTPEVIAELETDKKRRELITRVTGDPRPMFDDPIPFTAYPQVVTLSRETLELEPADCELLQQMASDLFKELGIRVLRRAYTCDRGWRSRIPPTLEVETLVPVGFALGGGETSRPRGNARDPPGNEDGTSDLQFSQQPLPGL